MPEHRLDHALLARMRRDWETRAAADPLFHIDANEPATDVSKLYARSERIVRKAVDPVLARFGVDPAGQRVLEIGCGMGRLFPALANRFGEVWGVDVSPTMIARGRRRCPVNATWLVGDGATLTGVRDATIDHVLSFEVFQHIPDPEPVWSYLDETLRVLRPGGTFQVQLRRGSDTKRQEVFRTLSPTTARRVARSLQLVHVIRAVGSVDTWIGCIIDPVDALTAAGRAGLVDVAVLPDEVHREGLGYWLVGRRPPEQRPD
jgi:ubiquinone/menaquinone biosynthesis C-methylase UbiE